MAPIAIASRICRYRGNRSDTSLSDAETSEEGVEDRLASLGAGQGIQLFDAAGDRICRNRHPGGWKGCHRFVHASGDGEQQVVLTG